MSKIGPTVRIQSTTCWLIFFLISILGLQKFSSADEPALENARFALLIGVSTYPHLGSRDQLTGSVNDVAIMQDLLTQRFGFPAENIVTLIDQQATGAGIRAGFENLVNQLRQRPADASPAQVVIHFSGHGSQLPDQSEGSDQDEFDDGLDEAWVPYDSTKQGGNEDIRDDEINKLVHEVCHDDKTQLLIVFDGCHSGSGARGDSKFRRLQRDVVPTRRSADAPVTRKLLPTGAVFLSACHERELEPEFRDDDKTYGLLTRFLVQTLSQQRQVSGLSYDLLQKAIVSSYQRDRRVSNAPTPQLEGNSMTLQKTVLGFGPDVDQPPYFAVQSTSNRGQVVMRGGKFHDVTVGSLFELFERPEQIAAAADGTESSLAWMRIIHVTGTTSTAQVIRWHDSDPTKTVDDSLPPSFRDGFAVLRRQEPGETSLRLKVVRALNEDLDSDPLGPGDSELPPVIADSLSNVPQQNKPLWQSWVTEPDQACDLILRIDGNYAALFPATGCAEITDPKVSASVVIPPSLRGGWGPIDLRTGTDDGDPPCTLNDYLRSITKARNLISLAQRGADDDSQNGNVSLTLMKAIIDEHAKTVSQQPWTPDPTPNEIVASRLTVPEGDRYLIRVTNHGSEPVYVTVLSISPNMGIDVVMPYEEPPIRLEAGESRLSDRYKCSPPHGAYYAVLLVTHEPSDFTFVKSPELKVSRSTSLTGGARSLNDQLAEVAFFQPRRSLRGKPKPRPEMDTRWHAEILSWRTVR